MEGRWSSRVRDVRSVEPVLRALQEAGAAIHVRHHLNDREDLLRQFRRWGQSQHDRYRIGYVALHGSPATVHIGRYVVRLGEVGDALRHGTLRHKVLHFGSCSVLDLDEGDAQELRSRLGVRVLTGFTTDVEWFASMAFELLLFEAFARYNRPSDAYNYLMRTHGEFAERLGFKMIR
jgi:hypothetical protein